MSPAIITRGPHNEKVIFAAPTPPPKRIATAACIPATSANARGRYDYHSRQRDDMIITGGSMFTAEVEPDLYFIRACRNIVFANRKQTRQVIGAAVVPRPGAHLKRKKIVGVFAALIGQFSKCRIKSVCANSLRRTRSGNRFATRKPCDELGDWKAMAAQTTKARSWIVTIKNGRWSHLAVTENRNWIEVSSKGFDAHSDRQLAGGRIVDV